MKRNKRKKTNGGAPENVAKALRRRSRVKRQTAGGRGKAAPHRTAETVTLEGVFAATERGFGFVTVTGESPLTEDIFIPARKRGGAMAGDTVTVAVRKRDLRPTAGGDFRIEGEITGILSRGFNELCGTLVETEGAERRFAPFRVIPDNLRLADAVEIASAADAAPGDKVLVRITDYGDNRRPPRGEILRSLGASLSLGANYESVLLAAGIRTEFPDEVLRDAEHAAAEPISPAGRLDLRDAAILTIDGADAKDLDDAISLEKTADGWLLGVHIADVSHYVREGSPTDKEAIARGTSVYFTDKVVPMLPECLSNGVCSLNAGTDKYALSARITLDKQGRIKDCRVENSIIRSKVRGVYSEVNDLFEKKSKSKFYAKYKPVYKMLCDMYPLYQLLAANSTARGVLELESAEAKIILDDAGMPVDVVKRERGDAEKMIEQFMLTANEAVARFMCAKRVPCVFRVHEAPSEEKLTTYKNFVHNLGLSILPLKAQKLTTGAFAPVLAEAEEKGFGSVLSRITLRTQMKAKYSAVRGDHFGLGLEYYCHFTSPIRRYPDLSVHRILKYTLANGAPAAAKHYAAFAAESAERSSENELRALSAERDIEDLYKVIYMQKAVGETFDAVISSVTSFGLFCELENTCEGLIPIERLGEGYSFSEDALTLSRGKHAYKLGQPLRVRVTEANVLRRRVYMELAEEESGKKKR